MSKRSGPYVNVNRPSTAAANLNGRHLRRRQARIQCQHRETSPAGDGRLVCLACGNFIDEHRADHASSADHH